MSEIVYYGAGANLRNYEEIFVRETGYPVCVCDQSKAKHGSKYLFNANSCSGEGGAVERDIVSLDYVKEKFPDYELWLTLAGHNIKDVYDYLIENEGIPASKIRFFGGREYRLGCFNLQNYIYISSDNIKTCAHFPWTNHFWFEKGQVLEEKDVVGKLDELEAWRRETIEKLRKGEKTSCHGCSALHWGFFEKEPHVEILGVGPNFKGGTKCNCNCFYCNQNQVIRTESIQKLSNYDIHRISAEYYDTLDTTILADGEPSILPDIDVICDLVMQKGWSLQLNTNAILYKEKLAEAIASNPKSFMAVALDAGSRETYRKIKRVDTYDRVIENLHKYKEKGCNIFLKYILIPQYNDNVDEIIKFLQVVEELDVRHVTLSQNLSGFVDGKKHADDPDMPEAMFCLFTYMVARLQEMNIEWDFQIEFVSKHDIDRIEKLRRK